MQVGKKKDTAGRPYYDGMYRIVPAYNVESAAFTMFSRMTCSRAACYDTLS